MSLFRKYKDGAAPSAKPQHGDWRDYPGEFVFDKADAAYKDGWEITEHAVQRELERDLRRRIDS